MINFIQYFKKYEVLREIFSTDGVIFALQASLNSQSMIKHRNELKLAVETAHYIREEKEREKADDQKRG